MKKIFLISMVILFQFSFLAEKTQAERKNAETEDGHTVIYDDEAVDGGVDLKSSKTR